MELWQQGVHYDLLKNVCEYFSISHEALETIETMAPKEIKPVEAVNNQQKLAVEMPNVKSLPQVKKVKVPVKAVRKMQQLA